MRQAWKVLLAAAMLVGLTNTAIAKTSDGETPAIEDICDGEVGAAFGLCNAYCEAMDCDGDAPQASDRACDKVADKYLQVTGLFNLPCEDLTCPAPLVLCECRSTSGCYDPGGQDGDQICHVPSTDQTVPNAGQAGFGWDEVGGSVGCPAH